MNNEIKEILENVQKCCEIMEDQNFVVYQKQDVLKVLDYITNLQDKVKFTEDYKDAYETTMIANKMLEEKYTDYKSRCEKATKLLKQAGSYDEETKQFCDDVWEELPKLLHILTGDEE